MKAVIWIAIILVALVGVFLVFNNDTKDKNEENQEQSGDAMPGRYMDIETYVRTSISEISPVKAVLGGKFYVTSIETADGKGTVEYEDGHVALVADFMYEIEESGKPTITSFTVREQ